MTYTIAQAGPDRGAVEWTARYLFGGRRPRKVVNVILSELRFENGRIVEQRDQFDFRRWAAQALGAPGTSVRTLRLVSAGGGEEGEETRLAPRPEDDAVIPRQASHPEDTSTFVESVSAKQMLRGPLPRHLALSRDPSACSDDRLRAQRSSRQLTVSSTAFSALGVGEAW